jgi:hypothetical protein
MTPSQADFRNLEQLHLLDHGDAIERFYWPKVSRNLSEYEVFWKRFIVLLTNRVDPHAFTNWIMLRDGLGPEYESLLMANYSTFYHCVVAHEQIEIGRKAKADRGFNHPELFFFSAKACLENLTSLRALAGQFLRRANITPRFPKSPDNAIHTITSYRDVFAHRSHPGRGSQHGRGLIPKLEHLPKSKNDAKLLWSYTMALEANEMTDALDFQSILWAELAKHLQGIWKELAEAFEQFRLDTEFISDVGLATFLPIYAGIHTNVVPSTANAYGASGMMIYENKKGS